ncbi:MAG: hypothetical protein E7184_01960 [Erysipelotrichaceae bacterium]|nr:hypothetical protein [Erysipelotrichaceae bacterium]
MKKLKQLEWILPFVLCLICVAGIFALIELDRTHGIFACVVAIVLLWVPYLITRYTPIKIPTTLQFLAVVHIFLGIFLGSGLEFFYMVSFWDVFLHTWSGFLFSLVAIWVLVALKEKPSLIATILFAVALSSMVGMVWEIYEFSVDSIVKDSNMQKFMTEDLVPFVGRGALGDTMEDMICNFVGSIVFAIAYLVDHYFNKSRIIIAIEEDFSN